MYDLTTMTIVIWLPTGIIPAVWIGRGLKGARSVTGCAIALILPFLAIAISILVMLLSGITHEFCEQVARLCHPTNHNNVWYFAIYPLLAAPVYWLIMLLQKPKKQ